MKDRGDDVIKESFSVMTRDKARRKRRKRNFIPDEDSSDIEEIIASVNLAEKMMLTRSKSQITPSSQPISPASPAQLGVDTTAEKIEKKKPKAKLSKPLPQKSKDDSAPRNPIKAKLEQLKIEWRAQEDQDILNVILPDLTEQPFETITNILMTEDNECNGISKSGPVKLRAGVDITPDFIVPEDYVTRYETVNAFETPVSLLHSETEVSHVWILEPQDQTLSSESQPVSISTDNLIYCDKPEKWNSIFGFPEIPKTPENEAKLQSIVDVFENYIVIPHLCNVEVTNWFIYQLFHFLENISTCQVSIVMPCLLGHPLSERYNISGEEKITRRKAKSIAHATLCFHSREAIGKGGNYPLVPKPLALMFKELVVDAQVKGNPFTRSEAFDLATLLLMRRNAISRLLFDAAHIKYKNLNDELTPKQFTDLCARINLTSEEMISIEAERKKHGSWGTLLRWWSQYIVIIVRAHPYLMFNVDETSLSMIPVAERVMLDFMRKSKTKGGHSAPNSPPKNSDKDSNGDQNQSASANSSPKRQHYFKADKEKLPHVTLACCICSSGHKQRPFFIIPEGKTVNEKVTNMVSAGMIDIIADSNGWMSKDGFLIWTLSFVRFVQNVRSQVYGGNDKDAILFLDSHSSRINPAALLIMRLFKIHVITFPPHCTHIIQPFDKSLVAPFKREYRKIQSSLNNDVSNIISSATKAFERSFTSDAIINAFAVTGLQPVQVARCLDDKHTHHNFDDLEFTSRASKSNRLHITSALLTSNKILSKIIKDANDTGVWKANQAEVKTLRKDISIKTVWNEGVKYRTECFGEDPSSECFVFPFTIIEKDFLK